MTGPALKKGLDSFVPRSSNAVSPTMATRSIASWCVASNFTSRHNAAGRHPWKSSSSV